MVSKWVITYLQMGCIGVITHLLTIDPNFQRDIQVIGLLLLVEEIRRENPPFACIKTRGK